MRAGALGVEAEDTLHESVGRGVEVGPEALAGAEAMQKGVTEDGTRDAELHQEGDTRAPVEAGLGVNVGQEVNAVMEATGAAPQFEAETAGDQGLILILTNEIAFLAEAGRDLTVKTGIAKGVSLQRTAKGVSLQRTTKSPKKMAMKIRQARLKSLASLAVTTGKILRSRISFLKSHKTWLTRRLSDFFTHYVRPFSFYKFDFLTQ